MIAVLLFETRRAGRSLTSRAGIGSLLLGSAFLALLAINGVGPKQTATTGEILFIFGVAWSSLAAVYAVDRNKNSVVEDIWYALEPDWRRQLSGLFAAWLPVAFAQALVTGALVLMLRPDGSAGDLLVMAAGFALALPFGLCMTALARLVPGFSLLSGVAFIAAILFSLALSALLPARGSGWPVLLLIAYIAASLAVFALLTRRTGRSR
ncbi:MAG: hypothetical protein ACXW27_06680 [Allosphingosinicella sp.]